MTDSPDEPRPYGRRAFLGLLAGGVSALAWAGPAAGIFSPLTSQFSQLLGNLLPVGGWRIYTVSGSMPIFDERTWRLEITGLVERPVSLTYAQLRNLPRAEQVTDFHCVTGWSVKNVRWAGVRFHDLLAQARPLPRAGALTFVSAEKPYVDSLALDQASLKDALLAYEMDGRPLSRPHGAPARVVIPEMYGYKNVKWVERIVVSERPSDGYWEVRGYDRNAWVGRSNGHYGGA